MGDTGVDDPTLGATGWPSDLGWELGDITGATEDWNYFSQGTYGYTPEARGPNFHATYANMVVTEYVGDASHPGEGVRTHVEELRVLDTATLLLDAGVDIRKVQDLLGHRHVTTTQIYTRVELSDLRKVLKRCHPRENPAP